MDLDVMDSGKVPSGTVTRLHRRTWPLTVTGAFVVTGMAYSLLWAPVVRHHSYWIDPGDLWATYRGAHVVGWGDLGGVYGAGTGLVTFPAILIVLAPVAMQLVHLLLADLVWIALVLTSAAVMASAPEQVQPAAFPPSRPLLG